VRICQLDDCPAAPCSYPVNLVPSVFRTRACDLRFGSSVRWIHISLSRGCARSAKIQSTRETIAACIDRVHPRLVRSINLRLGTNVLHGAKPPSRKRRFPDPFRDVGIPDLAIEGQLLLPCKPGTRSSMPSSPLNLKAAAWGWRSTVPSWNRMVAVCGPHPTTDQAGRFISLCQPLVEVSEAV
jgi:hypothetical protein